MEVNLHGAMSEQALIHWSNIAFDEIERIHHALSFHQPDSDLSALNQALLTQPTTEFLLSPDLIKVLSFAEELSKKTQGLYDISVAATLVASKHLPDHLFSHAPLESYQPLGNFADVTIRQNKISSKRPIIFDLGGIAKGYAVDQAVSLLPKDIRGSINAGGDMQVIDWQKQTVEVKYGSRNSALKKLPLLNSALATSGSYYNEGGSQYFNPKTQRYIKIKGSMSVFAAKAMHADALTKVAIMMTRKDAQSILRDYNASAISINRFGFSRQFT
ncbi:MAG: FAD:protein FMN transferase [Cognaticolwellia sp.]